MARYAFGPVMRRAAGPVLAVFALLAALATAAARHLPSSAIGGVRAGSLHAGTAAGADWALASFEPSAAAGKLAAGFAGGAPPGGLRQTGGGGDPGRAGAATGVFRQAGGVGPLVRTGPYGCGAGLPVRLKQAWGLAGPSTCSA